MRMPGDIPVIKSARRLVGVKNRLSVKVSCPRIRGVIVQSPAAAAEGNPATLLRRTAIVIGRISRRVDDVRNFLGLRRSGSGQMATGAARGRTIRQSNFASLAFKAIFLNRRNFRSP